MDKENWITTWENTTGNSLNYSNIQEEDRDSYKQASNNNTSIPNWLTTFQNRTL